MNEPSADRPDCVKNLSAIKPEPYERKASGIG